MSPYLNQIVTQFSEEYADHNHTMIGSTQSGIDRYQNSLAEFESFFDQAADQASNAAQIRQLTTGLEIIQRDISDPQTRDLISMVLIASAHQSIDHPLFIIEQPVLQQLHSQLDLHSDLYQAAKQQLQTNNSSEYRNILQLMEAF